MTESSALEAPLRDALAPTYQLIRRLGQGGMGTVFLARDPALKRDVAVKVLSPELSQDPEAHARFEREAQAVAALAHPNVVAIYGVGALPDGTPYFVMQYVAGQSLADRIERDGPVTVGEARTILGEVAAALAAAHAKGIIHRDIKPANVLQDDASGRVLVSDFGLAAVNRAQERITSRDAARPDTADWSGVDIRLTQSGMRVGTPQYMSPEQLVAEDVTEKTDVYALGLLAYELLLGKGPFEASTPSELIAAHLRDVPAPLASRRADVDPELNALVSSCLAKDADARPTAAEVAKRLSSTGVALLEWPPPGLEPLMGAMPRVGRQVAWASNSLSLSFAVLIALGEAMTDVGRTPIGTIAILLVIFGALGLALRVRFLLREAGVAGRAVRAGFSWWTMLEVAADTAGTTGQLMAGRGRFARANEQQRDRLRRLRAWAALLEMLVPLAAPALLLLLLWLALHESISPRMAGWIALMPILGQWLARWLPPLVERALVGSSKLHTNARTGPATLHGVAEPWYASLDAAGGRSRLGRGRTGAPELGRLVGGLALTIALLTGVLLAPLALVTLRGPLVADLITGFGFGSTQERLRGVAPLVDYAPVPDSSVSALDAGLAFHAMATMLAGGRASEGAVPERPRADTTPLPIIGARPLFVGMIDGRTQYPAPAPLFTQARRGFTADEIAFLREVAMHPVWTQHAIAARADVADLLGGRFVLPLPDDLSYYDLPYPRTQHYRPLWAANVARAALALSSGRPDAAEAMLRETFGVARALTKSTYLSDVLYGAILLEMGRESLEAFYAVTAPAKREELRMLLDEIAAAERSGSASENNQRSGPSGAANQRRERLAALTRPGMSVALRFEQLATLSLLQCSTLNEVVFGASPDLRRAAAFLRDSVARFESERQVADLMLKIPEVSARAEWVPDGPPVQLAGRMLDFTGLALGSPRIRGCARWLGNFQISGR